MNTWSNRCLIFCITTDSCVAICSCMVLNCITQVSALQWSVKVALLRLLVSAVICSHVLLLTSIPVPPHGRVIWLLQDDKVDHIRHVMVSERVPYQNIFLHSLRNKQCKVIYEENKRVRKWKINKSTINKYCQEIYSTYFTVKEFFVGFPVSGSR